MEPAERNDPRTTLVELEVEPVHDLGLVVADRVDEIEDVVDGDRVVVRDALLERHVARDRVLGIEAVHPLHEPRQPPPRQEMHVTVDQHGWGARQTVE